MVGVNRKWDHRRIIWTKDHLYITRPNCSDAIEKLPLDEIQAVIDMNDEPDLTITKPSSFVLRPSISYTENVGEKLEASEPPEDDIILQDSSFFSRKNSSTSCILQIKTIIDGAVAGRTLYLSTLLDSNPEQQRQAIISRLLDAVAVARKKALVLSRFQQAQGQVRWVQSSTSFQMAMAALIMLVSV